MNYAAFSLLQSCGRGRSTRGLCANYLCLTMMNSRDETGQGEERLSEREAQLLFEQLINAHELLGPLYVLH